MKSKGYTPGTYKSFHKQFTIPRKFILAILILIAITAGSIYLIAHGNKGTYQPFDTKVQGQVIIPDCTEAQRQQLGPAYSLKEEANAINGQINNYNQRYIGDIDTNWQGNEADKATYDQQIQTWDDQYVAISGQIKAITSKVYCKDSVDFG